LGRPWWLTGLQKISSGKTELIKASRKTCLSSQNYNNILKRNPIMILGRENFSLKSSLKGGKLWKEKIMWRSIRDYSR